MSTMSRLGLAFAVLIAAVFFAACGSESAIDPAEKDTAMTESQPSIDKTGTGERRTDLDPLTDRFAAIGTPLAAVWMSGTLGDERVPGPASYWIDAIITLDPAVAARLRNDFGAVVTDETPNVVDGLVDDIPTGSLLTSTELGRELSGSGFSAQGYLVDGTDQLVLVSVGQ